MDQVEFTKALARLSEFKIGVQEATVLFALDDDGTSNKELAISLGLAKPAVWSATNSLRKKGYLKSACNTSGKAIHKKTAKARKLIERVIPWQPEA